MPLKRNFLARTGETGEHEHPGIPPYPAQTETMAVVLWKVENKPQHQQRSLNEKSSHRASLPGIPSPSADSWTSPVCTLSGYRAVLTFPEILLTSSIYSDPSIQLLLSPKHRDHIPITPDPAHCLTTPFS